MRFLGAIYFDARLLLFVHHSQGGVPTIGVLGCPNLPVSSDDEKFAWDVDEDELTNKGTRGCIFVATQGGGCFQLDMDGKKCQRVQVTPNDGLTMDVKSARLCVGEYIRFL